MMRTLRFALPAVVLMVIVPTALSFSQRPAGIPLPEVAAPKDKMKIVPLVIMKPGETKELMLSTWCTVGITRSGGFRLTEMQNGKPHRVGGKSYHRDGISITVPTFEEGSKFAGLPQFALLKKQNIDAFVVRISASADAKPGLFEMHLVDSTCSGDCSTDFQVLIDKP